MSLRDDRGAGVRGHASADSSSPSLPPRGDPAGHVPGARGRGRSLPGGPRPSGTAVAAFVGFVILALVGALVTSPSGSAPAASPGGPAAAGHTATPQPPTTSPSPSPAVVHEDVLPTEGWAGAELPPIVTTAELEPTKTYARGISQRASFTLRSLTAIPAADLVAGLTAEPPLAFKTKAGPNARSVTVRPTTELAAGQEYRFTLRTSGLLAGSWVFRTSQPPRVVGTLPRHQATGVPVDTGIEITFDQDGVDDVSPYFSISPEVPGRFEQHGRAWVFVPKAALAPATVYAVTIRHGVPLAGSDQALAEDLTFAFETRPKPSAVAGPTPKPEPWFPDPARDVVEVDPGQAPVLGFDKVPEKVQPPRLDVEVRRFTTFGDAVDAYVASRGAPEWARWSGQGLVSTGRIPLVLTFSATLETAEGMSGSWIRFPEALEPGWYLVVFKREGRDLQIFLQVTDLAVYVAVTSTDTLVWVNDVSGGGPVVDASARFLGASLLGRTDADGVASGRTPASVRAALMGDEGSDEETPGATLRRQARATTLIVRAPDAGPAAETVPGRAAFVPVTLSTGRPLAESYGGSGVASDERYLHELSIDRHLYHRTDRVDAWGLVRERQPGRAPRSVELRLTHGDGDDASLALATVTAKVDPATGTFKASIPFEDLPYDWYQVTMHVGGTVLGSTWFSVDEIAKPAYRLTTTVSRHVAIDGDRVTVTVQGTFFDDTPAAAVPVGLYADYDEDRRELTTDAAGTATLRTTARWPSWDETRSGYSTGSFHAYPAEGAMEDAATSSDSIIVFPSAVWLEATGSFEGDRLNVTASTTKVDVAAIEKARADDPWGWDPAAGSPASARVTVQVTEITAKRVRAGEYYDPIQKRVIPTHAWVTTERDLGTWRASTTAEGAVTVPVPVTVNYKDHRVRVVATDAKGRRTETTFTIRRPRPGLEAPSPQVLPDNGLVWPHLGDNGCGYYGWQGRYGWYGYSWYEEPERGYTAPAGSFGIGDAIEVPFRDREGGLMPRGGMNRYLFYLSQQGLHETRVQKSPVFEDTFRSEWVPNISLAAVRFTGTTYEPAIASYMLMFDATERELNVSVATDAERYRPGGRATISVATTDPAGQPVAATVFVRVIDEKLYAMDSAMSTTEPLAPLYQLVGSGVIRTYATQLRPVASARGCYGGEGGSTGGGGGDEVPWRDDFEDVLLFARVRTGADGRGSASFAISDDLTSWRVTAAAVTADLQAGTGRHTFSVGLPFFVEAPVAPTFVAGDRPTLRVRAFGTELSAKSRVTFTVAVPDLEMAPRTVSAPGYGTVDIPLPALPVGEHKVRVTASVKTAGGTLRDALVRTVRVVATRLTDRRTVVADLRDGVPKAPGDGMATYLFTDAGRGRYLDTLYSLLYGSGERLDAALAAHLARDILVERFGVRSEDLPARPFTSVAYQNLGGVTLLPWSSPDLALSARVALAAPDDFGRDWLRQYFEGIGEDSSETRERRVIALAGRAALGDDVLPQVQANLADPALTIREQLYLALGAAVLGDHASALATERALLRRYGERLGQELRLRVGSSLDDTLEATALAALIGVIVGDPAAPLAEAYLEANPGHDDLYRLQQVAFVGHALDRLPAEAPSFSYTVGDTRHKVDLGPGGSFWLELTPAQRAGFSAKVRSGRVSVAVTYVAPVDTGAIVRDPSVRIERIIVPTSPIPRRAPVEVKLRVTFDDLALDRCYWVTDMVPSGLEATSRWLALGTGDYDSEAEGPWWVDGSQVGFCACPRRGDAAKGISGDRTVELAYWARVVMPGTYRWESAIVHPAGAPNVGRVIPETWVEVR